MPIVRSYPIGEVSPQPIPNVAPSVPAAGDINLFGGNRARDLQVAGQNLGQASDQLFALYQRHAQDANDTRVQDLNNQFITGKREILQTGPDAYYDQTGADAITGADAATGKLTTLRDQLLGQTANGYQREKLAPILDAHLAASTDGIMRHTVAQQAVYARGVAANAIETSRAEATADPSMMAPAVMRAEGAARVQHAGQPPEAVETSVRAAGASIVASVIGDRLSRNDPQGVALFQQYGDRLDPRDRRTLGAAAETLSNTVEATAWLRRSASLRTPAPTGDAALDAANAASASIAEPPPVVSSASTLLDDGIAGTRERLDEIDERRRALTALNESEFGANPARSRANQAAIDADTARRRAAVKAEVDSLYANLRRHLTTGGPNGGPAVTPPPATIMSRLTDAQKDAVNAQINGAIENRKTRTDLQTWYAIRQGLTGDDAGERERWASKNLAQFMGRLSDEDFTALEKLQTTIRVNDGGAEQNRLQTITSMANQALRTAGIDPTPQLDAPSGSDAAQAARFHRTLQDELSAVESKGRKPTEAEAYDIVNGLKDTDIKGGWLRPSNRNDFLAQVSNVTTTDDALNKDGVPQSNAEEPAPAGQDRVMVIDVPTDPESYKRFLEEHRQRSAAEQTAGGTGGSTGAPASEPDSISPEHRAADAQARAIVAGQGGNPSEVQRAETSQRPTSRGASMALPGAPEWLPGSAVLEKLAGAVAQAARAAGSWVARVAPAAAGITAGAAAEVARGALTLIVVPTNSGSEYVPINENLRVRTSPGQDAKLERRVDDGLFGIGAKWIDLPVGAAWAYDNGRRYVAIDRPGLEQAIGRDAADSALGGNGIAMAKPPSDDSSRGRNQSGDANTNSGAPGPDDPKEPEETKPQPPPRNRLPEQKAQRDHILREGNGHLPDTPENQKTLEDLANDEGAVYATDRFGNAWSRKQLPDGRELWVSVRNGIIQNGGINDVPRTPNSRTGFSSPAPRNSRP